MCAVSVPPKVHKSVVLTLHYHKTSFEPQTDLFRRRSVTSISGTCATLENVFGLLGLGSSKELTYQLLIGCGLRCRTFDRYARSSRTLWLLTGLIHTEEEVRTFDEFRKTQC